MSEQSATLVAKLLQRVSNLEATNAERESFLQQLGPVVQNMANEISTQRVAITRLEHFLFALIKVGLANGLVFADLAKAVDDYPNYEDLLVYWGERTQEEYMKLVELAKKKEEEASAQVKEAEELAKELETLEEAK